jgi:uncharacterized protein involved in exopolysaccharide biosynthesis
MVNRMLKRRIIRRILILGTISLVALVIVYYLVLLPLNYEF